MRTRGIATVCIAACSLTAGSIFCFPLFGPALTRDLGLSLKQTNTIWSGAVLGQYGAAAFMGSIGDAFGPRPLSLLAAVLFGAGYLLMARTELGALSTQPHHAQLGEEPSSAFVAMSAYFVLVGAGVAASLFAALRSSTSHFKSHPGLALSVPLTLFSLSSLFLSTLASLSIFTDPNTGDLNGPKWLTFLGASLMMVNFASAFGLSLPASDTAASVVEARQEERRAPSEVSPLLPHSNNSPQQVNLAYTIPVNSNVRKQKMKLTEFLCVPATWALAFILFASVGASEMIMSSVGSIVVSLRYGRVNGSTFRLLDDEQLGKETLALRTRQVQLIAVANTLSRLIAGLVSDVMSPSKSGCSEERRNRSLLEKLSGITISRITLLLSAIIVLLAAFLYAGFGLDSIDNLWIVSLSTGIGYGLTFTLVPSSLLVIWPEQFGRNYGILTYAAALGSLTFSMLFATINDSVASSTSFSGTNESFAMSDEKETRAICELGRKCFAPSFLAAATALLVAAVVTIPLWRAWRWNL